MYQTFQVESHSLWKQTNCLDNQTKCLDIKAHSLENPTDYLETKIDNANNQHFDEISKHQTKQFMKQSEQPQASSEAGYTLCVMRENYA